MGTSLPGSAISSDDLVGRVAPYISARARSMALRLGRRLGIASRHFVRSFDAAIEKPRDSDTAPKLAARALEAALQEAACSAQALSLLLGHTATPHTLLPANIAWVADELGFRGPHCELRQACTGFAASTVFAVSLISSGLGRVAIVGSETGSVMFDPRRIARDAAQLVNLMQMGDGAGAIVLGPLAHETASRIELAFYGGNGIDRPPGLALATGGSGAPGFGEHSVPSFIHDYSAVRMHGVDLLRLGMQTAAKAGIDLKRIDWWLPHQVNGRLPELCARWLDLPQERVICHAATLGNLGSAAIWVSLARLRQSGRLRPGDHVLVLGAEATKYMYGGFLYIHGDSRRAGR